MSVEAIKNMMKVEEPTIEPVRYHSLTENVAANLRESIIYGNIKPGIKITETELAETMGVSRSVVREAVFVLISEGLMEKVANRHTKVVEFSKDDIIDIFDLRIAIELAAIKRVAGNVEIYNVLEKLAAEIDNSRIVNEENDYIKLIESDILFHDCLIRGSGNRRLVETWTSIMGPMKMLLFLHMNAAQATKCSHTSLLQCIREGDIARISNMLESHISDTRNQLLLEAKV